MKVTKKNKGRLIASTRLQDAAEEHRLVRMLDSLIYDVTERKLQMRETHEHERQGARVEGSGSNPVQ